MFLMPFCQILMQIKGKFGLPEREWSKLFQSLKLWKSG